MMRFVTVFGIATLLVQAIGPDTIGGLMALLHLGGFVGAPLAMLLNRQLRSWTVVVVLAIGLSISLSALAVQSLIWFSAASGPLLVAVATLYGVGLAGLLVTEGGETRRAVTR